MEPERSDGRERQNEARETKASMKQVCEEG